MPDLRSASFSDRALAISAVVTAVAAVAASLYGAAIERHHQRLSVWPYVTQYNTDSGSGYARVVSNAGIGPALVRSFEVRVDGRPAAGWRDVLHALIPSERASTVTSGFGRGSVLLPGNRTELIRITDSAIARRFHAAASGRLRTVVCYCSLYEECWLSDSEAEEPESVRSCRTLSNAFR